MKKCIAFLLIKEVRETPYLTLSRLAEDGHKDGREESSLSRIQALPVRSSTIIWEEKVTTVKNIKVVHYLWLQNFTCKNVCNRKACTSRPMYLTFTVEKKTNNLMSIKTDISKYMLIYIYPHTPNGIYYFTYMLYGRCSITF